MRMLNRAIEDARDFRDLITKIEDGARKKRDFVAAESTTAFDEGDRRFSILPDRQPGENREAHRARLKRERREAKAKANKARA